MRPETGNQAKGLRLKAEGKTRKYICLSSALRPQPSAYLLLTVYCLLFAIFLSGCIAIAPEEDPVKKDIDRLKQDMADQKQRVAFLEETIKKQTAELEQGLAPQKKQLDSIDEAVQRQKADVNASIDKIREDMAFLRGRFEEIEQAAKKITENMASLREKTDLGLQTYNLDTGAKLTAVQNQLGQMEKKLAAADARITSLEGTKTVSASDEAQRQQDNQGAKTTKPDELYNEAIKLIKDKDFKSALEKLNRFLSLFPDHELASNAQYWIGEVYYAEKDYERAILEFNEVIKKYPKAQKASAALFKQGLSFLELGNKKEARLIFERIMDKYPKSKEAGAAKKMLKGMK